MKIPALPVMASVKPSLIMASSAPMGLKLETNSAPTSMPMNSELKVSLVISARTIATIGGTSAQKVFTNSITVFPFF